MRVDIPKKCRKCNRSFTKAWRVLWPHDEDDITRMICQYLGLSMDPAGTQKAGETANEWQDRRHKWNSQICCRAEIISSPRVAIVPYVYDVETDLQV